MHLNLLYPQVCMYCSLGTLFYENKKGKLSVILLVSAIGWKKTKSMWCIVLLFHFKCHTIHNVAVYKHKYLQRVCSKGRNYNCYFYMQPHKNNSCSSFLPVLCRTRTNIWPWALKTGVQYSVLTSLYQINKTLSFFPRLRPDKDDEVFVLVLSTRLQCYVGGGLGHS